LGLAAGAAVLIGGTGSVPLAAARIWDRARLSGTYQLDIRRSDDPRRAAEKATRDLDRHDRDSAYRSLMIRLEPPESISLDANGRTVSMASSRGPAVTFYADGRRRHEDAEGPGIETEAELNDRRLTVTTSGNRGTDYQAVFESIDNGNGLRVTRRLDAEYLRGPVSVVSYYHRVADLPDWNVYRPSGFDSRYEGSPAVRSYPSPSGTRLVAVLDRDINSRNVRDGDRFTMIVRNPSPYDGATLEGVVRRDVVDGRERGFSIDFDRLRWRDGRTMPIDARLDSVRTPDGAFVPIDRENGVDRDDTAGAVQRGAVGAAVGALIGAIAGGGKGAAIGAAVGGAGTVILGSRSSVDLPRGTEMTVTTFPSRQ
jgi:hypothetical protein